MRITTSLALLSAINLVHTKPLEHMRRQTPTIRVDDIPSPAAALPDEDAMIEPVQARPDAPPSTGVSITAPPAAVAAPNIPTRILLYSGPPGSKTCRGHVIMDTILPPGSNKTPVCLDTPAPASCGTYMANMDEGCQARSFESPGCREFVNVFVFMPELRPEGGVIRSIEITCGIKSVMPAPLNLPGMDQKPAHG